MNKLIRLLSLVGLFFLVNPNIQMVTSAAAASSDFSTSKEYKIFGGKGHDIYLGCIGCSEFKADSICNGFGNYGNEFSSSGMFNEFSGFGNEFASKSPWNEYSLSNDVPVLVDDAGNFYGYFTTNEYRGNAVAFAGALASWFNLHDGDIEQVRRELCRFFGQGH